MQATAGKQTTLALGGTGKTGRRVAERLTERGLPVRIGSRSAQPPFDWDDQATWTSALEGVGAVYLTYYPDLAMPGAADAIGAFARLAVDRGVRRLVLLSGRGEEEAQQSEQVLRGTGADWTIIRSSWFMQNFSEDFLLEPVHSGQLLLPVGDVPEPFVSVDDIADVAVAALTEDGHVGQVYEVTGPRMLTFAEAAAEIAKASGRDLQFTQVPVEEFGAILAEQMLPQDLVEFLIFLFTEVLDGRNAYLTDGVRQATGRPPRDFTDFAREAAASGVWDRP